MICLPRFFRRSAKSEAATDSNQVELSSTELPKHVAIIMDGNGRWAKSRSLPRVEGHRMGAKTVRMAVEECRKLGIRYLTLFCFSSENWGRPEQEVSALMKLFVQHLEGEAESLAKNGVRLRAIGDLGSLPVEVREKLNNAMERTKDKSDLDLILAISYGGRDEIVQAVKEVGRRCRDGELNPDEITPAVFSGYLYAPDVPDPDLLIRTSSELRISNFLLWQLAYSEIVISPLFWPEFSKDEFVRCLREYCSRSRRFGLTAEQVA